MTRDERQALLADLRASGVRRWRDGDLEVELAPAAPPVLSAGALPTEERGNGAARAAAGGMLGLTADDAEALFQHEQVTVRRG